jgi:hypothetical protein
MAEMRHDDDNQQCRPGRRLHPLRPLLAADSMAEMRAMTTIINIAVPAVGCCLRQKNTDVSSTRPQQENDPVAVVSSPPRRRRGSAMNALPLIKDTR